MDTTAMPSGPGSVSGAPDLPGGFANAEQTMRAVADDVQRAVLPSGHWVAEQAPTELLAAVTAFLAPYRDDPGVRSPAPDLASIR